MSMVDDKVMEYLLNGLHCSQVVFQLSLDLREREEPFTVRTLGALGGGMFCQRACGTVTGGVCLISSYFPREDGEPEPMGYQQPARQLVQWFEQEYGSLNCCDLVLYDQEHIMQKCPGMMARTFEKCIEILEEHGVDPYG